MSVTSSQGFVCQQYLQSYSASGLVLLDSFPPTPSERGNETKSKGLYARKCGLQTLAGSLCVQAWHQRSGALLRLAVVARARGVMVNGPVPAAEGPPFPTFDVW